MNTKNNKKVIGYKMTKGEVRLLFGIILFLFIVSMYLLYNNSIMSKEISNLLDVNKQLLAESEAKNKNISDLEIKLENSEDKSKELFQQLVTLREEHQQLLENNKNVTKVDDSNLKSRGTTTTRYTRTTDRTKYDLAVQSTDYNKFLNYSPKSSLTWDDINWMKQMEHETGVPHLLVLSIIMNESGGYHLAYNKNGGASGIGQFLAPTGRWIWEDKLGHGKGSYDHAVTPMIKENNLKMMFKLLQVLKTVNKTYIGVVDGYRGIDDAPYKAKIEKFMGLRIEELPW